MRRLRVMTICYVFAGVCLLIASILSMSTNLVFSIFLGIVGLFELSLARGYYRHSKRLAAAPATDASIESSS